MSCGFTNNRRAKNPELVHRVVKLFGKKLRDLPHRLTDFCCPFLEFILSLISVTYQMSDIGNILDMRHLVTDSGQDPSQNIIPHVLPPMPDMRVVIHRHAAGIESYLGRMKRDKVFKGFGKGVVKANHKTPFLFYHGM